MVMQDVNHQLFTEDVLDELLLSMGGEDEKADTTRAKEILNSLDLPISMGLSLPMYNFTYHFRKENFSF